MFDFASLIVLSGLLFGLIVGDAAYFGDPISLHITVPPRLVQMGYSEPAAEELFATEAAAVGQASSIVPTPTLEISTHPTLSRAIATPLHIETVVVAMQGMMGIEVTTIHATIVDATKTPGLDMMIVINEPREPSVEIDLSRDDGDVRALIRQAAGLALQRIAPYRVALTEFSNGVDGDRAAFGRAREAALRALAQPWVTHRTTERVMLHNLLALLAVVDGDMAGAETQFRMADLIPGALPGAYGTVSLNRALLAVGARQPAEARRWFQKGQAETKTVHLPGWGAQMSMLSALIAWSDGNQAQAETLLRSAIAAQPTDQKPHAYLAELLAAHGDTAGAAEQRAEALAMRQLTPRIPSLAQSEFWVDPANGGLQLRQ